MGWASLWSRKRGGRIGAVVVALIAAASPLHAQAAASDGEAGAVERLAAALPRYRALAARGSWPTLPAGIRLALGDSGAAVLTLRSRLALEDFAASASHALFDAELDAAVRAFQRSRGLEVDGVVGRRTAAALAVPAATLADRIALNLERMRREAPPAGGPRVEVMLPEFELRLLAGADTLLRMRVIAGTHDWPTPVFDAPVTHVVFNPYWEVPPNIAAREVLPAVRRDPSYLQRNDMEVLTSGGRVVDPATIDWRAPASALAAYRFRQRPGPRNPLGLIKFLVPSPHHVLLHDTPGRAAFERADRALSHGCIRIQEPAALAQQLLGDEAKWSRAAIDAAIRTGAPRTVALPRPVTLSVRYRTAWVDETGVTNFRDDIYGRDSRR